MFTLTPSRFVWVSRVALAMLVTIVVTGSLVRLSGSGLGCVDWPQCNEERFVDVSSAHAAIEQINRLFTGLVALSVILALASSLLTRPRIRVVVGVSLALVMGVLAQVVIGGIVVLTGLHPTSNMLHFMVSVVLVGSARILVWESRVIAGDVQLATYERPQVIWSRLLVAAASTTVVAGTIVTASGPHAGDESAPRFDIDLSSVVRVHGIFAWITAGILLYGVWRSKTEWRRLRGGMEVLLGLLVAQIFVGYLQYFSGVPAQLVAVHIALSMGLVIAATDLVWKTSRVRSAEGQPLFAAGL